MARTRAKPSKTTPQRCMGAGRPSGLEGPHKAHVIILRGHTMLVLKATARPRRRRRWRSSHAAQRCTKITLVRARTGESSLFCAPRARFAGRRVDWHGDQLDDFTVLWRAEGLSGRLPCGGCGGRQCLGTASRRPYGQRCPFGLALCWSWPACWRAPAWRPLSMMCLALRPSIVRCVVRWCSTPRRRRTLCWPRGCSLGCGNSRCGVHSLTGAPVWHGSSPASTC